MLITVKAARVNANLSQKQTAEHLGISLTAYVRKENGKTKFYIDEIVALSKLFNVPLLNFFESRCHKKTQTQTTA